MCSVYVIDSIKQVRAIHVEECITFSTKERVPLLVCLEVRAVDMQDLTGSRSTRPSVSAKAKVIHIAVSQYHLKVSEPMLVKSL